ncbi:MAG: hypothetical protein AMJ78_01040 [Omnitrophica WOR_2 bacterium SM23_29]|nr:MAG: hypothetical protein AMJ78_01040 [Omnitrophica WOR_2 bacterium SM23_29]
MDTEVVIIGAGAIGLAIARKVVSEGHSAILLEKEPQYGLGISSRSSEVIHAGIYYHTGSLKASLCLEGKILVYEHCKKYNIKHEKVGKLFIAVTKDEIPKLELTKRQAMENGVDDLIELDSGQIKEVEPGINAVAALLSPSSGIFDSHSFMKSLLISAESDGLIFAANSPVVGAERANSAWTVRLGGKEKVSVTCKVVINAAGLYAIDLSNVVFHGRNVPRLYPTKGSYIRYSGKSPVQHIIYPAIVPGLIEERVDATPDLEASLRFGPNTEKTDRLEDFSIAKNIVESMAPAIKRYLPNLDTSRLQPDISGIRPRIFGSKEPVEDFCFDWAPEPGWLDLWGIESPGLTASLAIANYVYALMLERDIL